MKVRVAVFPYCHSIYRAVLIPWPSTIAAGKADYVFKNGAAELPIVTEYV